MSNARSRPRLAADVLAALAALLVEATVVVGVWFVVGINAWADNKSGREPEGLSYGAQMLIGAGAAGAVALVVAVFCGRARMWVTTWTQALAAVVLTVGVLGSFAYERHTAPPPARPDHVWEQPPCRSGTDCSESGG
ncbi:DUF6234 family protein [Streptomyces sp. NPDC002994]|uniref:DUF6234 family protein n=1 Tax=Streptomyces sp. NPDC002994 TaxID=3154441 RepID=UPI0033BD74AD